MTDTRDRAGRMPVRIEASGWDFGQRRKTLLNALMRSWYSRIGTRAELPSP